MKRIELVLLLFVLLGCSSCAVESSEPAKITPVSGSVSGTMTYKGKTTKLEHVYAQDARDLLDEGAEIEEANILLSERPLSSFEPDPQIPVTLKIRLTKEGQQHAFVYLDGKSVFYTFFFATGIGEGCPPQTETLTFKGKALEGNVRLSADKCLDEEEKVKKKRDLAYEVSFKVPIQPPVDKKIPVTARTGKPLPAGGGEPGEAAAAFLANLTNSAELEIQLAKARNASPPNDQEIQQKQAQLDDLFTKMKSFSAGGRNIEEADVNELFALNVISNLEKYEVLEGFISGNKATLNLKASFDPGGSVKMWAGKMNLVLENKKWKILRVGMMMLPPQGGEMYW